MGAPRTPPGLGRAGRGAWRDVCSEWELTASELVVLAEVCRVVDRLDVLDSQARAALADEEWPRWESVIREARMQGGVFARLVATLKFPVVIDKEA